MYEQPITIAEYIKASTPYSILVNTMWLKDTTSDVQKRHGAVRLENDEATWTVHSNGYMRKHIKANPREANTPIIKPGFDADGKRLGFVCTVSSLDVMFNRIIHNVNWCERRKMRLKNMHGNI